LFELKPSAVGIETKNRVLSDAITIH